MHRQGPRGPVFPGSTALTRIPLPGRLLATILLTAAAGVHADEGMAPPRCPDVVLPATATPQAGTAQLGLLLNEAGDIEEARLLRSSGHAALDEAARAMALRCRFQPYRVHGEPGKAWVTLPVHMQAAPATPVLVNGNAGVRIASLDLRHCAPADYPAAAKAQGAQGTTQLALLIGTDGVVQASRLERSSGYPQLDEAARAALGACRFAPALQDGVPLQQWARTRYAWQLAPGS